jgi:hypothetical protein
MRASCSAFALLSIAWVVPLASCSDDPNALNYRRTGEGSNAEVVGDPAELNGDVKAIVAETPKGATANETCFNMLNEYRKKNGLDPYERWTDGEACANGQAKSDGSSQQVHGSFARCDELAQNECPGTPGQPSSAIPLCLSLMWREGPGGGHYDSMTSTTYTKAACGVFVSASGATWAVQNFQ